MIYPDWLSTPRSRGEHLHIGDLSVYNMENQHPGPQKEGVPCIICKHQVRGHFRMRRNGTVFWWGGNSSWQASLEAGSTGPSGPSHSIIRTNI